MIATTIISSTIINRGTFMPAAQQITGENHVACVDARPATSVLAEDLVILQDFAGSPGLETSVSYLGVLVAGLDESVDEFISLVRGMPHLPTSKCPRGMRAVVITGSLDQWKAAIVTGMRSSLSAAFSTLFEQFIQIGLSWVFEDFRTVQRGDQLLLEHK